MIQPPDFNDLKIMAQTIFGEARGETRRGRMAVGCVIMNRAVKAAEYTASKKRPHPLFGNGSLTSACLRKYQFSCWNENDPNLAKLHAVRLGDSVFNECVAVALDVIANRLLETYAGRDPSCGALHYYVSGSPVPGWHQGERPSAMIGRHLFFNNIK